MLDKYEVFETKDYITVQPKGRIVDARACKTYWKREGWTLDNVKQLYDGGEA